MSQYPQPQPSMSYQYPGAMQPVQRSNGLAIASLICGLLICVPFISGMLALILGFAGIKKANRPGVGGKGMAIAGLILGLVSLAVWSLGVAGIYAYWASGNPVRQVASQFAKDLTSGNINAAHAACTSAITAEELQDAAANLQPLGTVTDTIIPAVVVVPNQPAAVIGVARFGRSTQQTIVASLIQENGKWKIEGFTFADQQGKQGVTIGQLPKGSTSKTLPAAPSSAP